MQDMVAPHREQLQEDHYTGASHCRKKHCCSYYTRQGDR